jgi:hypothetical protein
VIAGVAIWVLYVVWRSPRLITYGGFAVAVVGLAAGWIASVGRAKTSTAVRGANDQGLDHLADLLAVAVEKQWTQAAVERGLVAPDPIPVTWGTPSLPMAGPAAAAAGSLRFAPLPGLPAAGEKQLAAGQIGDLHAVYGGLGSGRLVIAGAGGSGKSGAAVLLILAALKHREQVAIADRCRVPVPVLFTAQDWDPGSQKIGDWLALRLQQTYTLLAGKAGVETAAALINAGKVALILDGLDEMAEELRPIAMQALSYQAAFRLVVLARTAEMAPAVSRRGILEGAAAIELRAVPPATAASYLRRVQLDPSPEGWRGLTDRILKDPGGPLVQALNSPLTLTLVRDTYLEGDDARKLLEFSKAEDVTSHLLDRVLPAAYVQRPGDQSPRYDLHTAQRALVMIAARMSEVATRDLQWWRLPAWAPAEPRVIAVGLVAGLVPGITFGLVAGRGPGLGVGLAAGLMAGTLAGLGAGPADRPPRRVGRLWVRHALSGTNLLIGLGAALIFGLTAWAVGGPAVGLVSAVVGGLVAGVMPGLRDALTDPDVSSLTPLASWRSDRRYALVGGLLFGLGLGLFVGLVGGLIAEVTAGPLPGLAVGVLSALGSGLVAGLGFGLANSTTWSSSLASAQLAMRLRTPVRLMRFLEDARERGVLRAIGPVYQFRHARLQDRLAGQERGPQSSDTISLRAPASRPAARLQGVQPGRQGLSNIADDQYRSNIQHVIEQREKVLRKVAAIKMRARRLVWAGFLAFVMGFGLFTAVDLKFINQIVDSIQNGSEPPPGMAINRGVFPWALAALGIVLLIAGTVLYIAAASKRKRVNRDFPLPRS